MLKWTWEKMFKVRKKWFKMSLKSAQNWPKTTPKRGKNWPKQKSPIKSG
jgi:hypothetical protein